LRRTPQLLCPVHVPPSALDSLVREAGDLRPKHHDLFVHLAAKPCGTAQTVADALVPVEDDRAVPKVERDSVEERHSASTAFDSSDARRAFNCSFSD